MLYLVRHGHAGDKRAWRGNDRDRPLSATGRREADGLVTLLRGYPIGTIVSSPAVRCSQTVRPLAAARRLPIRLDHLLEVGADTGDVLARLYGSEHDEVVWCTHGELIGVLLDRLRRDGAPIGGRVAWPKGSVWLLELTAGAVRTATFLPPRRNARPPPDATDPATAARRPAGVVDVASTRRTPCPSQAPARSSR